MIHKMWYDDELEIVHLEFMGDYKRDDVPEVREKLFELMEDKPHRQLIVYLHKTSKVEDRETRQKSNEILIEADVSHVAFIGGSAANRMIAKVLLKTGAIKTKGDFFKKKESGIKWLLSQR